MVKVIGQNWTVKLLYVVSLWSCLALQREETKAMVMEVLGIVYLGNKVATSSNSELLH